MEKMNTEAEIKKLLNIAEKDSKIIAVLLFGSYAREEEYRDIDFCLVLDKKYSNLEMSRIRLKYLSSSNKNLDIQIFQQLPIYIRKRILKEAKILSCNNEDLLYEIAFQTIKEFEYFKKIYETYMESIK